MHTAFKVWVHTHMHAYTYSTCIHMHTDTQTDTQRDNRCTRNVAFEVWRAYLIIVHVDANPGLPHSAREGLCACNKDCHYCTVLSKRSNWSNLLYADWAEVDGVLNALSVVPAKPPKRVLCFFMGGEDMQITTSISHWKTGRRWPLHVAYFRWVVHIN